MIVRYWQTPPFHRSATTATGWESYTEYHVREVKDNFWGSLVLLWIALRYDRHEVIK